MLYAYDNCCSNKYYCGYCVKFKELAEIDDVSALITTFMLAPVYCCGFVLLISIKMSLTLIKIKFYNLFSGDRLADITLTYMQSK